jgi:lipopolysaccharide transport system ATP-binding protein
MTDIAIKVENLGKMYRIGAEDQRPDNLWDAAKQAALSPFDYLRRITRPPTEEEILWALKDVSFEVERGEVLGIIGRNGAGKSTLLKVLSRITEPTEGQAIINGRVGSLLEVGTGFHPELTGRENIYLNGAILGMTRAEIDRKFDEIVDFSGVERFIDTPVKRYSSGMYVRLAFAVAAHLDPEILLIDEVLSVGDAAFQKKCLGKMEDVSHQGRTVLFVSHNMAAVRSLCGRGILLNNGRVSGSGSASDVVTSYLDDVSAPEPCRRRVPDDKGNGYSLRTPSTRIRVSCGESIRLEYSIESPHKVTSVTTGLVVYDLFDTPVLGASSKLQGAFGTGNSKRWRVVCDLGTLPLNAGRYYVSVWFGGRYRDYAKFSRALSLIVSPADPFDWGNEVPSSWGYFFWEPQWEFTDSQPETLTGITR